MRKKYWFISLLFAVPLVLAACGAQSPPEPLELTIDMKGYSFEPSELVFTVGQEVTLHLANSGALEHEIMFGRDVMTTEGRPDGFVVDMFESAGVEPVVSVEKSEGTEGEHMDDEMDMEASEHSEGDEHEEDEHAGDEHAHPGFMVLVPATHDIYTMNFTVTEDMVGEWDVGCFLLDGVHYNSGMVGSLTVEN